MGKRIIEDQYFIFNEDKYKIKVDYEKFYKLDYFFDNAEHVFSCILQSLDNDSSINQVLPINWNLARSLNSDLVDQNRELNLANIWRMGYGNVLIPALKNWIATMIELKSKWEAYANHDVMFRDINKECGGKLQIGQDFVEIGKIPKDQNEVIVDVLEYLNKTHFEKLNTSKASIHFSLPYKYEYIDKALDHIWHFSIFPQMRTPVWSIKYGLINVKNIKDIREDYVIGKEIDESVSLFKDVKLPYEENKFVFMIMPFSTEKFAWLGEEKDDESLRHFISSNSEAPCITLDDDHESDDRVAKIYNYIKKSKFCIAEISSLRPNIVYEVGLAHGIGRKVILLCSMPDLRIQHPELTDKELFKKYLDDTFDINHNRIHFFEDHQELKSLLGKAIEHTMQTP